MEPREADLELIGERLCERLTNERSPVDEIARARTKFLEEVAQRQRRARLRRPGYLERRVLWPVAVVATVAVAAGVTLFPRSLSFQVGESRLGHLGDLIESTDGRSMPLEFSEGSRLVLHEGGRMRVLNLSAATARVLVEDGVLDVSVAPKLRKTRWTFEAGAYLVTVTGTKFQLAYDSTRRSFHLATREGQVVVSGGCQHITRKVSAGEEVKLTCPPPVPSNDHASDEAPGDAPRDAPGDVPGDTRSDEESQVGSEPEGPPTATVTNRAVPSWRLLLAAGRLSDGLRAAERDDLRRVYKLATSKELLALADGARLFGSSAHAVAALKALRQRYPGTTDAATAAFRLGLIAFEKDESYAQAALWFETYVHDQPAGPLMGDAFGRIMRAKSRAGDREGAREGAQEYLRRFPKGPYAREARGILSR